MYLGCFLYKKQPTDVAGKKGVIIGNSDANLDVYFNDLEYSSNCHPYWEIVYFDKKGDIVKDYRKQTNNLESKNPKE